LRSFRVVSVSGQHNERAVGSELQIALHNDIELGLSVPSVAGAPLVVDVRIKVTATATDTPDADELAALASTYVGRFLYDDGITEATVAPLLERRRYQYELAAQVYPLVMTHFRRELQSMGLDARELPLGLAWSVD